MKRSDTRSDTNSQPSGAAGRAAEDRFARRLCLALDESTAALPQAALDRLALARKAALRAQGTPAGRRVTVTELVTAGGGGSRFGFARAGFVASAVLLVGICLAGLFQLEQDRRIEDLADVDTAVLNDDLPISAYADHGFNAYLKQTP